jgi:hypothetical protein
VTRNVYLVSDSAAASVEQQHAYDDGPRVLRFFF